MKANCYRLIGYQPNYRGKKKEGIAANNSFLGDDSSHIKDNYDQHSGVSQTWSPYGYNGNRMPPFPYGYTHNGHGYTGYSP